MNKYKEAYATILDILIWPELISTATRQSLENSMDTIEELLGKETPMLVTDIHVDEFYCPRCHNEITHYKGDIESRPTYCEECGQRFEWKEPDYEQI